MWLHGTESDRTWLTFVLREEGEESEDEEQHSYYNEEEDQKTDVDPENRQWI